MDDSSKNDCLRIAELWCAQFGAPWAVIGELGAGGTAVTFEVSSPEGARALKIYDKALSTGDKGSIEQKRVAQQLALRGHACRHLVQIYDGGDFRDHLFLVMERASGFELEKRLADVPRERIRGIVSQVAEAAIFLASKNLCHRDIKAANIFISDDFEHSTLLDVSVIRDIHEPIGMGTDRDGQLPVLATSRYASPEYLFRLLEPGPDLWNGLTVYQLGALLHDLIMRLPMFQAEYERSRENRYRFAWYVSTIVPEIIAEDVDADLVFIARRALDKNWKRRASLKLEDFLDAGSSRDKASLVFLGLAPSEQPSVSSPNTGSAARVLELARNIDVILVDYFASCGIRVFHEVLVGPHDNSRRISVTWQTDSSDGGPRQFDFQCLLELQDETQWNASASLEVSGAVQAIRRLEIPPTPHADKADENLGKSLIQAITALGRSALSAPVPGNPGSNQ